MRALVRDGRAPRAIVLENVYGCLTSRAGQDFAAIAGALAEADYRFGAAVIDAAHFAPQSRPRVFFIRPEVVSRRKSRRAWRSGKQLFREAHVPVQRFKNMLPRTYGMRTANAYGLTRKEASDEIGDKTVGRPVASADDIASACSRDSNPMLR